MTPSDSTDKVTVESADETKVTASYADGKVTVTAVAGLDNSANGDVKVTVKAGSHTAEITVTIQIA